MKARDEGDQAEPIEPRGRLVMIAERELSKASKECLKALLGELFWEDDVTMVSGLSRASVMQAGGIGKNIFYNPREYLSPEQAFSLLPWREVWLVADGQVWKMTSKEMAM